MIHYIDTETNGLNFYLGNRPFMITHFSDVMAEPEALYPGSQSLLPLSFELSNADNEWVGHNLAFDLTMLSELLPYPAGRIHDTMIMAHVYHTDEPSKKLKELVKKYLNWENHEEQRIEEWFCKNGMRAKEGRQYDKVPRELMEPYAKADVAMTRALFKFYWNKGIADDPIYKLEMSVLPVCMAIQKRGMRVDRAYMVAEAKRTATLITQYAARGKEEFNIDNLNSEEELSRVLFAPGACTCGARTDTGKPKLDETTLLGYDHPLVPLVLDYREVLKVNGTYLNPIIAKLDANGHIHGNLNQVGARTGRMSSSAPNLQNISRSGGIVDLRRGFICEPDYKMLLIDLSQIELRVLAHYCKEQVMLDTLRDRKGDLHAATANVIFGSAAGAGAVSLTARQQRTIAKTINFATIYGAGAAKLCHTLNKAVPDAGFTQQQTRAFKRAYLKGYPLLQEFIWAVERTIRESGFVFDIFGRKYYCDPKFAYRGVNYLVQGCSAGIAKLAACRLHQLMARRKSGLINLIHDEFVIALHPEDEALVPEMMRVVEDFTQFRVPIYANASISDTNWSDKRDLILP